MDVVIPFVTCKDEVWMRETMKQTVNPMPILNHISGQTIRYNLFYDYGTLKYVLRGIDKYMPYVDNVFLLVSNIEQVPDYIDKSKVRIILHKEFIPEDLLPIYNSCTIELFLNKIPGLGEEFVYFNDDMIPVKPISYDELFKNGLPCIHFINNDRSKTAMTYTHVLFSFYEAKNSVQVKTGHRIDDDNVVVPLHMPTPLIKSVMDEYSSQERHQKLIKFYGTRTRNPRNINQYYWADILYFSGQYVKSDIKNLYVDMSSLDNIDFSKITDEQFMCVNDVNEKFRSSPLSELEEIFKQRADKYFTEKCRYEL